MKLEDLSLESQFRYKLLVDGLETVNDPELLKESIKTILLDFMLHQEATQRIMKDFMKGIERPQNKIT
jgi:hypothetical protein